MLEGAWSSRIFENLIADLGFEVALAKLRELWQPLNGVRSVEVTNAGGGLISPYTNRSPHQ